MGLATLFKRKCQKNSPPKRGKVSEPETISAVRPDRPDRLGHPAGRLGVRAPAAAGRAAAARRRPAVRPVQAAGRPGADPPDRLDRPGSDFDWPFSFYSKHGMIPVRGQRAIWLQRSLLRRKRER